MMAATRGMILSFAAGLAAMTPHAAASADAGTKCQIASLGTMNVDFRNARVVLPGKINDHPVRALIDTGATSSILSRSAAADLKVPLEDAAGYTLYGVGGVTEVRMGRLSAFSLGDVQARNISMLVAGERRGDWDLLIGRDFWGSTDVEYDLANNKVQPLKIDRACGDDDVVFWGKPGQAFTVVSMLSGDYLRDGFVVPVRLNGKTVRALIDSGASRSTGTLRAAQIAGVAQRSGSGAMHGVGRADVEAFVGELDSFAIGDEAIKNTRLVFGDLFGAVSLGPRIGTRIPRGADDAPEMLLGADFLRAHHVLISPSRRKVYITYEGGPVFDTRTPPARPPTASPAATPAPPPGGA